MQASNVPKGATSPMMRCEKRKRNAKKPVVISSQKIPTGVKMTLSCVKRSVKRKNEKIETNVFEDIRLVLLFLVLCYRFSFACRLLTWNI